VFAQVFAEDASGPEQRAIADCEVSSPLLFFAWNAEGGWASQH